MSGDNGSRDGQPQRRKGELMQFVGVLGEPEPIAISGRVYDNKIVARGEQRGRESLRPVSTMADLIDLERDMGAGRFRPVPSLATQYLAFMGARIGLLQRMQG